MKRKDRIELQEIEIESIAAEGKALAHTNGKVIFVPFAAPGDVVDVRVTLKRKGYMEGVITNLKKSSPVRVEPFCSHFGVCGGCKWQHIPYSMQLQAKEQQVVDQLTRIGKLQLPPISPILGSEREREYRNKLEYTFSSKRWIETLEEAENLPDSERLGLGFHISGLFDKVLDIKKCHLQPEPTNAIRLFIKEFAIKHNMEFFNLREQTGLLRNMIVRDSSTGEVMVIVVFAKEDKEARELLLNAIKENFPQITSLNWVINPKRNDSISDLECHNFCGNSYIYEEMEELKFRIAPQSFFQTNSNQAYRLYSVVREMAALKGDEVLYDLYTGTGTIALFLARYAAKVIGVEYVEEAVADARVNSQINGIENCSFFAGDMKDILSKEFIETHGHPDVIILDPPRAGVHPSVAKVIAECAPQKIVYVSCNPATQARDIALLGEQYKIERVQPVDMFPHTHHLENVVLLQKN